MAFTVQSRLPFDSSGLQRWFLLNRGRLLVKDTGPDLLQPYFEEIEAFRHRIIRKEYLGRSDGIDWYAADVSDEIETESGGALQPLRQLFGRIDTDTLLMAGLANQLIHWSQTHQYCGRCGGRTRNKTDERAKYCPSCDLNNYPRISPAVIVAVTRGNRLLLARSRRARGSFHSVLAGFVEPAETLEDCVKREVFEEVGIRVNNIRYFGSQPWPFPDALMVAFTAEYADGEIRVDPSEIMDAGWFTAEELPANIPTKVSIARRLIEWFRERPPGD